MRDIQWSEIASHEIHDIVDYLIENKKVSPETTLNFIAKIEARVKNLARVPIDTQKELSLKNKRFDYRYMVEGSYKIIYHNEENALVIDSIFHTSQHPSQMGKYLK